MARRAEGHSGKLPFYLASTDAPAKQRILTATLKLFVRDGICETSIRDIAEEAGFTNPALFKHFASKDELADYLFERCYLELFRLVERGMQSSTSFRARQKAILIGYTEILVRDQEAVLFVQDGLRRFWPRMPAVTRKHSIVGRIRLLLSDGREEGAVTREIDLELLTVMWMGTIQQFARGYYFGNFKGTVNQLASNLDDLLTRVVRV